MCFLCPQRVQDLTAQFLKSQAETEERKRELGIPSAGYKARRRSRKANRIQKEGCAERVRGAGAELRQSSHNLRGHRVALEVKAQEWREWKEEEPSHMGETDNIIGRVEGIKARNDADDYALMDPRDCGARCQNTSCLGLRLAERSAKKSSRSARECDVDMEW
jgi:hypothetical protein